MFNLETEMPDVCITDPELEQVKPLLARMLPQCPSPQTIHRWLRGKGRRKQLQRLPALKIQGKWYSTPEAVAWFVQARTEEDLARYRQRPGNDVSEQELQSVGL